MCRRSVTGAIAAKGLFVRLLFSKTLFTTAWWIVVFEIVSLEEMLVVNGVAYNLTFISVLYSKTHHVTTKGFRRKK